MQYYSRIFSLLLSLLLLASTPTLFLPQTAFADDLPEETQDENAFNYVFKKLVLKGNGKPEITLTANADIQKGSITIKSAEGKVFKKRFGKLRDGKKIKINLRQSYGTMPYTMNIDARLSKKRYAKSTVNFEITYLQPIVLTANGDDLSLANNRMTFHTNREVEKAELTIFDNSNNVLSKTPYDVSQQGRTIDISWLTPVREVGNLRVRVSDKYGSWAEAVVTPFWVDIPHQEVSFDTGQSTWQRSETSKLKETVKQLQTVLRKHRRDHIEMQLYIIGYTDTVGAAEDNLHLSFARARSIATWFKQHGPRIPIYYQGFGESVLAKPTPDNTPELQNRHVIYLLGSTAPPTSSAIPKADWRRVN